MANIRYDRFYQYNPYNPEYPTSPFYHGAEDGYGRKEPVTRYADQGHISYADRPGNRPYRPNFSADYGRNENRQPRPHQNDNRRQYRADYYRHSEDSDYGRDEFGAWDLQDRTSMSMPEGGIYGETLRGSHVGKGPKGWSRSDERIRDHVCDVLEADAYIDASEIEVTVKEGIVTLSGKVDHRSTKRRATDCVENLAGVRDVDNNLSIDLSFFEQAKEILTGEPEARATHQGQGPKSARH